MKFVSDIFVHAPIYIKDGHLLATKYYNKQTTNRHEPLFHHSPFQPRLFCFIFASLASCAIGAKERGEDSVHCYNKVEEEEECTQKFGQLEAGNLKPNQLKHQDDQKDPSELDVQRTLKDGGSPVSAATFQIKEMLFAPAHSNRNQVRESKTKINVKNV